MAAEPKKSKGGLINFYDRIKVTHKPRNPNAKGDSPALVHPFNAIIVGGTGSGKTNALLNIIQKGQNFDRFIILTKVVDEPLYEYLKNAINSVQGAAGRILVTDNIDNLPEMNTYDKDLQTLVVFDDQMAEPKNIQLRISEYAIRCRKNNASSVYISQTYFGVPKTIRLNSHYVILKRIGSVKDIRFAIRDYGLTESVEDLMELYNKASGDMTSFFMIDIKTNNPSLKYRKNFTPVIGSSNQQRETRAINRNGRRITNSNDALKYLAGLRR